jgi:hypothetical protein
MTMKTAFAIVALGALACTSQPGGSGENASPIQQARAAIKALEDRDEAAIEACMADVRSCLSSVADGGASGVCEELREQCRQAEEALEGVRKPAVDCWRGVERCADEGKSFAATDAGPEPAADAGASCHVRPRDCAGMGEDSDDDRNPILECKSEVRQCLSSVRHRESDWRDECGDVREACSDICGLAVRASHEHGRRGGHAEGLRSRMRDLLSRMRDRRHDGHGSHDGADAGKH